MKEPDSPSRDRLDLLLARTRARTFPTLEPDPRLPARIRAMAHAPNTLAGGGSRLRWASASLVAAALVLAAGTGAYIGYRAGTVSEVLSQDETKDADAFLAALSQSGFVDELSRLDPDHEVNE